MINLEQIRAQRAFEKAAAVAQQDYHEKFLSLAQNLPAMFQTNGLLATWAFLLSKSQKNKEHKEALQILLAHFRDGHFNLRVNNPDIVRVLTEEWTGSTATLQGTQLMRLTAEAVAFSGWLKRAAEALCDR